MNVGSLASPPDRSVRRWGRYYVQIRFLISGCERAEQLDIARSTFSEHCECCMDLYFPIIQLAASGARSTEMYVLTSEREREREREREGERES